MKNATYRALLVWALHQLLGTKRGDAVYAKLAPIIALAEAGGLDNLAVGEN